MNNQETFNQTGATSEARWSTGGTSGASCSGTATRENHLAAAYKYKYYQTRKTPAGGTEYRERPPPLEGPDATECEQHMENGDTGNDHLVVRGSIENAPSGYPVVLRRRLPTAHGGGPTCPGVSAEEPPDTTAEEHAGMPDQPPPAAGRVQELSRATGKARVWLGPEVEQAERVEAEAEVEAERERNFERESKRPKTSWWTAEFLAKHHGQEEIFGQWTERDARLEAQGVPRYDPKA